MSKEYKGGIAGVLVMIPLLLGLASLLPYDVADNYGFAIVAFAFLVVNLLLAYLFSAQRTGPGIAMLFLVYSLVTAASTVLLGIILFFIVLSLGIVPFQKIGG